MSWFFTNLISAFLLPPFNLLLAALAGLFLGRSRPRLGRTLLVGSLALLWLCATPYVAEGALRMLEGPLKAVDPITQPADAIVVLGDGTYFHAPEYGGIDTMSAQSLARLRYAAQFRCDGRKMPPTTRWRMRVTAINCCRRPESNASIWSLMPGTCRAPSWHFMQPDSMSSPLPPPLPPATRPTCSASFRTPKV